jgi:hypothetical protein
VEPGARASLGRVDRGHALLGIDRVGRTGEMFHEYSSPR